MTTPSFGGLHVLALESRREREMATPITTHGGEARVAPSMREVPLESNTAAAAFADALVRGEFDVVVLLTGVGTRVLLDERTQGSRDAFVAALGWCSGGAGTQAAGRSARAGPHAPGGGRRAQHLARAAGGIDASGADAALGAAASPCRSMARRTSICWQAWRRAARGSPPCRSISGRYRKTSALLEDACRALATKQVDVALFTTATAVVHLLQVAERMGAADPCARRWGGGDRVDRADHLGRAARPRYRRRHGALAP